MVEKFILFDIDGTLIDAGRAGTCSINRAFDELFLIENAFKNITLAGKTDVQIIKEALVFYELSIQDDMIGTVLSRYLKNLKEEANKDRGHVKPGVKELLERISQMSSCVLGLLTGNVEEGARIKLQIFGLNEYFTFGAFGDDNEDRNLLLPIALKKLKKAQNINLSFTDCIVIGDTPDDVKCSKPYGAMSIAVATGPYSYDFLAQTEADYVLHDLSTAEGLILNSLKS